MGRLGMTELIRHLHPNSLEPNTHIRGSQRIDYIFGTAKVRDNSVEAGILPFEMGYHSDHRAIFVSIQMEKILTTKVQSSDSITARKLQQAIPKERDIFIQEAHRYLDNQNIYNRLRELQSTDDPWTEEDKNEYELCDQTIIHGMLLAESRTKPLKTVSWSPAFGKAVSKKSFWKIALSLKMNYTQPNDEFMKWAETMEITDFKSISLETIKKSLRAAQKELKEIEKEAEVLREAHLRDMLTSAELNGGDDQKIQKRLKVLIRAHEQKQHFRGLKQVFKPQTAGGLSYILIPKNFNADHFPYDPAKVNDWEQIHETDELQRYIQLRNIQHFGQAHGTPFTISPLNKIEWQANSIKAQEIIEGSIPTSFLSNTFSEFR
jgi:hypothetical protein